MARTTKSKKQAAPQVDIGAEIFASLRDLEKLKGIPVDYMVERLKQALANAYRKDRKRDGNGGKDLTVSAPNAFPHLLLVSGGSARGISLFMLGISVLARRVLFGIYVKAADIRGVFTVLLGAIAVKIVIVHHTNHLSSWFTMLLYLPFVTIS